MGVIMIFVGKIFITGMTTFLSYIILRYVDNISEVSYSTIFPVIFIGFSSYFISAMYV